MFCFGFDDQFRMQYTLNYLTECVHSCFYLTDTL